MRSVFEFVTQDEFQFIELVRTELKNRGYESRLIVVKPGSYAARADRASAYKFIVDVVLPRKERIPEKRYALAEAYARYLFRTMRRGLGKGIRGKLR